MKTLEAFKKLLFLRWKEAQQIAGLSPNRIIVTWEISDNYDHFHTTRGYGVTIHRGACKCHLAFPHKILKADVHRQDGVIRHEIGHVFDMCIKPDVLNEWAEEQGVKLPAVKHAELRADKIAEAIWKEKIKYDEPHHIQSTCCGVYPRPAYLGT